MKTIIISVIVFISIFVGVSYALKNHEVPMLSQIGKDVSSLVSSDINKVDLVEDQSIPLETNPLAANVVNVESKNSQSATAILSAQKFKKKTSAELRSMFSLGIPSDADCIYSLNEDYVVCTSFVEQEEYIMALPVDERQLAYMNKEGAEYYPLPVEISEGTLSRYEGGSSSLSMGSYEEVSYGISENAGPFDINFEQQKDLSSYVISDETIEAEYKESQEFIKSLEELLDFDTSIFMQEYDSLSDTPITQEVYESLKNIQRVIDDPVFLEYFSRYKVPEELQELMVKIGSQLEEYILIYEQSNGLTEASSDLATPFCGPDSFDMFGDDYIESLAFCSPYNCQFTHPSETDFLVQRSIQKQGDSCNITDIHPNNLIHECSFSVEQQAEAANFYKRLQSEEGSNIPREENTLMNYLDEGICSFETKTS